MSSQSPQDPRELMELYALGQLEEPERSEVEALLRSGSAEASRLFQQALENNAMLTANVPLVSPSARLRSRVLAAAGEKQRSGWLLALAAAAAAGIVMTIGLGFRVAERNEELATVRSELQQVMRESARTNSELARVRRVVEYLNAPETRVVTFGPKDPTPPRGRVLLNPGRGVVLIASNLPPAPDGRIYEMWLIRDGKPVPAGLFQSSSAGTAVHVHEADATLDTVVAVTIEPEQGSAQPTTTPLFAASL